MPKLPRSLTNNDKSEDVTVKGAECGVSQLDALGQVYRRGLVRKAKALKVAVSRDLQSALSK